MSDLADPEEFFTRVEPAFAALLDERDFEDVDSQLDWKPWPPVRLSLSWVGDDEITRLIEARPGGEAVEVRAVASEDRYRRDGGEPRRIGRRQWTTCFRESVRGDEETVRQCLAERAHPAVRAVDSSVLGNEAPLSNAVTVSERPLSVSCVQSGWMNWRSVIDDLRREYGLRVEEDSTNSSEAFEHLREGRRNYAVFNGGYTHCLRARNEGYTREYRPAGWEHVPKAFKTEDGHLTATRQVTLALTYRRDRYQEPPRTWEELLDSTLVDDLVLQHTGAIGLATLVSVNHALGGTLDTITPVAQYYRDLKEAGATFVRSFVDNDIKTLFKRGDYGAFVRYDYSGLQLKYTDGDIPAEDVGVSLLASETNATGEGSLSMLYGNALLKSAPAPDANRAKLFMDHVLSLDGGQRRFLDSYIRPVRIDEYPDSELPGMLLPESEYERAEFKTDYERLLDRQESVLREVNRRAGL